MRGVPTRMSESNTSIGICQAEHEREGRVWRTFQHISQR